jgi:hypothetical protein
VTFIEGRNITVQSSRSGSLGEALQANRLPIALIGVGIAWLLVSNTGLTERVAQDPRVQTARRRLTELASGNRSAQDRTGKLVGPSGEPAIRTHDAGRSDGWVHRAAGAARGAIDSVRNAGSTVLDRAGAVTEYAGDAGKRVSGQLAENIERDPWLIGVVGFVAGALLAAILPPTRTEQELLVGAKQELRNRAAQLGHDAAERVREFADSTARDLPH